MPAPADSFSQTATDKAGRKAVGRFAPSPSGRMHLGNVYTAVMSWLSARSRGGRWILRIEDLDPQRSKPEYARMIEEDLLWLGLEWDEGGLENYGPNGPYLQSLRSEVYAEGLRRLEEAGLTYRCRCRRADILATQAPHESDGRVIYKGTCRPPAPRGYRRAVSRGYSGGDAPLCSRQDYHLHRPPLRRAERKPGAPLRRLHPAPRRRRVGLPARRRDGRRADGGHGGSPRQRPSPLRRPTALSLRITRLSRPGVRPPSPDMQRAGGAPIQTRQRDVDGSPPRHPHPLPAPGPHRPPRRPPAGRFPDNPQRTDWELWEG